MWNLSRSARTLRAADTVFVSVPKCGRTWVRAFLHAYFSARAGLELTWDMDTLVSTGAPRIAFTHDHWERRATPRLWRKVRGADLIPTDRRRNGAIVLLARDPRDVLVSLHFQLTRRESWHRGDLSSMVRHPRFGIDGVVRAMNAWLEEWRQHERFMVIRYEDLHADTDAGFRRLLAFLGVGPVDEAALAQGLAFSSFDNMKGLERAGHFEHGTLRPGDPEDPGSYKMRRGEIGPFGEYLSPEDLARVEESLVHLDPVLGYGDEAEVGNPEVRNPVCFANGRRRRGGP